MKSMLTTGLVFFACLFISCSNRNPVGKFESSKTPAAPDYTRTAYWAALPQKKDNSDLWAGGLKTNNIVDDVDIFYLSPTLYTGSKRYQKKWNATVDDKRFNSEIDDIAVKFQASIFNGVGRLYAPYYRQAHIKCYYLKDSFSTSNAFQIAYQDVKSAFEYYMQHYNQGRPVIIASHSQGTTHALRLLAEYFDNKPLAKKLVVAYLLGMPVAKNQFKSIPTCENPEQTNCFCSWRTFGKNYVPKNYPIDEKISVVNPLTWKSDTTYAPAQLNKGSVFRNFNSVVTASNDAQIYKGILWTNKPRFPGSFLLRTKNYHAGDFNIYYMNVRENAAERVKAFWK